MTTNPPVAVRPADVVPDTIRVDVTELRAGDAVFSVLGDESQLRTVRRHQDGSVTVTHECSGRRERLRSGPVTIRREAA